MLNKHGEALTGVRGEITGNAEKLDELKKISTKIGTKNDQRTTIIDKHGQKINTLINTGKSHTIILKQ